MWDTNKKDEYIIYLGVKFYVLHLSYKIKLHNTLNLSRVDFFVIISITA